MRSAPAVWYTIPHRTDRVVVPVGTNCLAPARWVGMLENPCNPEDVVGVTEIQIAPMAHEPGNQGERSELVAITPEKMATISGSSFVPASILRIAMASRCDRALWYVLPVVNAS